MRIGSRIKTWWQKKSTKYAAAGTLLLALSGAALALGVGSGARAASSISELNTANGQITTADEFLLLRNATGDETENQIYNLTQDIVIGEITSAATGTFAGTFNGNGHVITIEDINITDSTDSEASHGILFGTVAENASVYDLIINITDGDASYTRNSTVEHSSTEDGEPSEIVSEEIPVTIPEGSFSNLDSNTAKKNLADELDNSTPCYVDEQGDITSDSSASGTEYRREEVDEPMTRTVTYELGTPGNDYFGILCGTLSERAEVTQVEVTGNSLTVHQNASEVSYQETYEGTRQRYDYYQVTKGVSIPAETINESIEGDVTVYSSSATTDETGADNVLSVSVSAPRYVKQAEYGQTTVEYKVNVNNISDDTVTGISLSTTIGDGEWSEESPFELEAGAEKDLKYTVTDTGASIYIGTFTVSYTGIRHEASVKPKESASTGDILINVNSGVPIYDGGGSSTSTGNRYTITVQNNGETEITVISLGESSGNVITASEAGTSTSSIIPSNFSLQSGQRVEFICDINEIEYTPEFTIQYVDSDNQSFTTGQLQSEVIVAGDETTIDSGNVANSDLSWALTTDKNNYFEGDTIVYSLTLTNTWSSNGTDDRTDKEIQITSSTGEINIEGIDGAGSISWSVSEGNSVLNTNNRNLVLNAEYEIGSFSSETVTIKVLLIS